MVARGMLKPVYFAFETMLEFFFANYTFCKITSTFAKTNEQNNRDHDSFETRHFDEGRPCGEPPKHIACSAVAHAHAKKTPVVQVRF